MAHQSRSLQPLAVQNSCCGPETHACPSERDARFNRGADVLITLEYLNSDELVV